MESTMSLSRLVWREEVMLLQLLKRLLDLRFREVLFVAQEDRPQPGDVRAFRLPGSEEEMYRSEEFQAACARLVRDELQCLAQPREALQRNGVELPILQFVGILGQFRLQGK